MKLLGTFLSGHMSMTFPDSIGIWNCLGYRICKGCSPNFASRGRALQVWYPIHFQIPMESGNVSDTILARFAVRTLQGGGRALQVWYPVHFQIPMESGNVSDTTLARFAVRTLQGGGGRALQVWYPRQFQIPA